jgi:hypothetical protein
MQKYIADSGTFQKLIAFAEGHFPEKMDAGSKCIENHGISVAAESQIWIKRMPTSIFET